MLPLLPPSLLEAVLGLLPARRPATRTPSELRDLPRPRPRPRPRTELTTAFLPRLAVAATAVVVRPEASDSVPARPSTSRHAVLLLDADEAGPLASKRSSRSSTTDSHAGGSPRGSARSSPAAARRMSARVKADGGREESTSISSFVGTGSASSAFHSPPRLPVAVAAADPGREPAPVEAEAPGGRSISRVQGRPVFGPARLRTDE